MTTSEQPTHPVTNYPALPTEPRALEVTGDLADEMVFRRFVAQNLAAQTLSAQRTEWYARSTRLAVHVLAWLGVLGVILGFIFGIIAATSGPATPFG